MRVAALQMNSGSDVAANLAEARGLIETAAGEGARLVVLPENFAFMGAGDTDRLRVAEPAGVGPIQAFLATMARDTRVWLVGGTVPIRCPEDGRAAAACLTYAPTGQLADRYDKIHLFDVAIPGSAEHYRESAVTAPGSRVVTVDTEVGRVGLAVCYDIRFPALFDRLGRMAMEVLAVPAAFTVPTGSAHWHCLLRARCIESMSFGIAAAQWGVHPGGRETYGHSLILGPWGETLAELPSGSGVCSAEVDIMSLHSLRERFPALQHRREL